MATTWKQRTKEQQTKASKTTQTPTEKHRHYGHMGSSQIAAACVPMNSILQKANTRKSLQDCEEGAKTTNKTSVAESQDPSSQDPGDPILEKLQEGRPALFQKDGGAMLIAIVLDRPLQEAQDLVDQPLQFLQEIKRVLDDQKSTGIGLNAPYNPRGCHKTRSH